MTGNNLGRQQPMARQGRVNYTTLDAVPEGEPVMADTFYVRDIHITDLFDTGASHSFISTKNMDRLGLQVEKIEQIYSIITPGGQFSTNQIARSVPLKLGNKVYDTNLISLGD